MGDSVENPWPYPWERELSHKDYTRLVRTGPSIDSKETAERLGVTEGHLRQMVKRGFLSVHGKKGKRSTFLVEDVDALVEARLGVSRVTTPSEQYADLK